MQRKIAWVENFPVKELQKKGLIEKTSDKLKTDNIEL